MRVFVRSNIKIISRCNSNKYIYTYTPYKRIRSCEHITRTYMYNRYIYTFTYYYYTLVGYLYMFRNWDEMKSFFAVLILYMNKISIVRWRNLVNPVCIIVFYSNILLLLSSYYYYTRRTLKCVCFARDVSCVIYNNFATVIAVMEFNTLKQLQASIISERSDKKL